MVKPLIELQGLTASYNHQPVFENLDLNIAPRQFVALVGPTGGGKSTLLKAILGLLPCSQGSIRLPDQTTIGYVPQHNAIDWGFPITVQQVVMMGRYRQTRRWPWSSQADRREVKRMLDRMGIGPYAKRHISELSGGQQQRVFLARALIGQPQLLLLDEPTAGVDMKTQHDILHLLREFNGQGITILLTTHDLNTIASHIPWVVCFNHGIVAQGTPGVIFQPSILRQTYNADMVVVRQGDMTFIANHSLVHRHSRQTTPQRSRSVTDGLAG